MQQGLKHTQKQVVCESTKVFDTFDELYKTTDVSDLNFSDQEGPSKEGDNVDVAEIVAIQKGIDPSTLPLHKFFDLLHEDCELPLGEVRLADKDPNHASSVTLLESAEIVEKVSKEIDRLDQDAHSKVSVNVENDTYEPVILKTKDTTLSKQHNKTGRQFFLSVDVVSAQSARDPSFNAQIALYENDTFGTSILMPVITSDAGLEPEKGRASKHVMLHADKLHISVTSPPELCSNAKQLPLNDIFVPLQSGYLNATIITPITTYDENFGPDKGRISQPANSKNTSEACKKSEKLLRKL
ncbi:hypothetical protein MtrunA17_Chr1g0200541 [Medicago truncatula]|uniref:Uncharacterized protein n=1 Tax=Medicago truncatula TaxID=3880 RepID=A0A396JW91_MEDTR|nr:hypothetical protein MtrunA17_Chr1g0200541 [Medicago truncatula]